MIFFLPQPLKFLLYEVGNQTMTIIFSCSIVFLFSRHIKYLNLSSHLCSIPHIPIIIYHHTTFFTSKSLPPIYALLRQIKFTVFVIFAPSIGRYLILLREAQLTQSTPYNTIRFTFWVKVNLIVLTIYSKDRIFSLKKLRWSIKFVDERAGQRFFTKRLITSLICSEKWGSEGVSLWMW